MFVVHDLKLEASVEPFSPVGGFHNEESKAVYEAALVLYHLPHKSWYAVLAIEALEDTRYDIERLDLSSCQALYDAVVATVDKRVDVEYAADLLEWELERAEVALFTMWEVLSSRLEEDVISPVNFSISDTPE